MTQRVGSISPLEMKTSTSQSTGLRSARAVARDRGVSPITIWRYGRAGLLNIINVAGRPYVDLASLAAFDERARAGEFAKAPSGAAKRSADARKARQAGAAAKKGAE